MLEVPGQRRRIRLLAFLDAGQTPKPMFTPNQKLTPAQTAALLRRFGLDPKANGMGVRFIGRFKSSYRFKLGNGDQYGLQYFNVSEDEALIVEAAGSLHSERRKALKPV